MKLIDGNLLFEKKDCEVCTKGEIPAQRVCPVCNGTGKGTRGKVRGCKRCYGNKTVADMTRNQPCLKCKGNYKNFETENAYDYLPKAIYENLEFRVIRTKRQMNFNESHIGEGTIFCCTDYGAAYRLNDDKELIQSVRNHTSHQACKFLDKNNRFCDHIEIVVKEEGYVVIPAWNQ